MNKRSLIITIALAVVILVCNTTTQAAKQAYMPITTADTVTALPFTVNNLFNSNMVLQRNKPNQIWGTAKPGTPVSLKATWNAKVFKAQTDADGKWTVTIPGTSANAKPQTITLSATDQPDIKLANILIGDVWVCSGQSNMVMYMEFANVFLQGVTNFEAELKKADHPNVRFIRIDDQRTKTPAETAPVITQWSVCTPVTAAKFSALGYYFATKLDSALNIPIGIVVSAVGSTGADQWASMESMQADSILNKFYGQYGNAADLYNGMIYPLRKLAVKGFLWDQGETNGTDNPASNYTVLQIAMVKAWRKAFNQGDLPFYFVQMIPTKFTTGTDHFYALFREAQANTRVLKNTGMAVTTDVDELANIHYRNKAVVADRFARLALHNQYGKPVVALGPSYKSLKQNGNTVTLTFNNAKGLKTVGPLAQIFTVAGDDKVFYPATATINGKNIILTIPPSVTAVKAVRYAFTNEAVSRLYSTDDMPVEPFRTDSW